MKRDTMIKYAAVVAAALLCAGTSVYATATISLGSADMAFLADQSGAYLADGSLVEMGQFSLSDASLSGLVSGGQLSTANYATLLGAFTPLNMTSQNFTFDGTDPNCGVLQNDFLGNQAGFASGKIYIMVFKGATTAASQVGVFSGDSSWTYPANMVTGATVIDTDFASAIIGTIATKVGSSNAFYMDNTGFGGSGTESINALELVTVIPEPSTIALVGLGLLGAVGLMRRRS